jgi:hypothetical protein
MMKRYIILLIGVVLLAGTAYANPFMQLVAGRPPSGSPVTFYFNANSATSGQAPSIGTGTVTIGSSVTAVTGQVGNSLYTSTSRWNNGSINFPSSGNIDFARGAVGFWVNDSTIAADTLIGVGSTDTGTGRWYINNTTGTTSGYRFYYQGSYQSFTIATGWHFVEISWDDASTSMAYRIDGGSWTEKTDVTGDVPVWTTIIVGPNGGNPNPTYFDQIIISSNYKADLYAVRNNTSF